jgi:hypothetical protein
LRGKSKAARPDVSLIRIAAYGNVETKLKALEGGRGGSFHQAHIDFGALRREINTGVE